MADVADIVILNVDDQEAPRYAKTRVLRRADFTVVEAATGYEALRLTEELRPAVVVLDVKLPDLSGIEVCGVIKRKWPGTLVLQTSATFTGGADRVRGLEGGADGYLIQPIDPDELIASVRALLRVREAEDKLRLLNQTLEQRVQERTRELATANASLQKEIAQRHKSEAALVQAQKMEAIGHLTGGIAHDFNNLLTAVVGNLDLIRARASDPKLVRLAESAFRAAERGSKLTSQLLAFSRTQKLATRPVDLNTLISGMSDLLGQSLGASVVVHSELAAENPAAMADPNQLELAVLNLAINARDAMPDGGTLTIRTGEITLPNADGGVPAGSYATIDVCDAGAGMSADVLARAFDPFFTTKPAGKGTGLGLSQVYGIAAQSGGTVRIRSRPGEGTTVSIWLPRAAAAAVGDAERAPRKGSRTSGETILVVDDDADVRDLVRNVLSDLGYRVHQAEYAGDALPMLDRFAPDLLILDFAMPEINGAEVAHTARQKNGGLKILFVSGYADSSALETAVGSAPLLRKPFRPGELAVAVRAALDGTIESLTLP
jgi:signal transduction histidine kinase